MKLLNPAQTLDIKAREETREVLRMQEYNKATEKARHNFNQAEADFNLMLAGQRQRWANEEKEHEKRSKEMTDETKRLEIARAIAMQPIEQLQKEAEMTRLEANKLVEELEEKQAECDELNERLQDKLDSLGEREQNVLIAEQRNKLMQDGNEMQRENIILMSKDLTDSISKFKKEKLIEEQNIDKRKTELFLMERSLIAKDESIKEMAKKLEEWKIRLQDERDTLNRAFARISPYKTQKRKTKI
jgi:hypothetical protein